MRVFAVVARIVLGLGAAAVAISILPVETTVGPPFGGCPANPYTTLERGCSAWPEIVVGLVFVLVFASIAPARFRLLGLVPVAFVTAQGGLYVASSGLDFWREPLSSWPNILAAGMPLLLGATVAVGLHAFATGLVEELTRPAPHNNRMQRTR